jgi:hypothetical protein
MPRLRFYRRNSAWWRLRNAGPQRPLRAAYDLVDRVAGEVGVIVEELQP